MSEDDGLTIGYQEGQVRHTEFHLKTATSLDISITGEYTNMEKFWCAANTCLGKLGPLFL